MQRKKWPIIITSQYIIPVLFYMPLSLFCNLVYYTGNSIIICIPGEDEKSSTKYYTFSRVVVFIALAKLDFLLT